MSKFSVELQLGDSRMRGPADVARALRHIAEQLDRTVPPSASVRVYIDPEDGEMLVGEDELQGTIRDLNGNTVGRWTVTHE